MENSFRNMKKWITSRHFIDKMQQNVFLLQLILERMLQALS